jgi:hypothetical protein
MPRNTAVTRAEQSKRDPVLRAAQHHAFVYAELCLRRRIAELCARLGQNIQPDTKAKLELEVAALAEFVDDWMS